MYRIKNTADDRTKHLQHRTATKFELEPSLGGHRIRLGTHYDISDEHYIRVKLTIDEWVKKGMVDAFPVLPDGTDVRKIAQEPEFNSDGLRLKGPIIEDWLAAGYQADDYPPEGYAEVFSPGLVAFRRAQEEAQEAAKKADEAIRDALSLQVAVEQSLPVVSEEPPPPTQPAPVVEMNPPVTQQAPSVTIPPAPTVKPSNRNNRLR